jgi:hypothetical protein
VRDKLLASIYDATTSLDRALAVEVQDAILRIQRSKYKLSVIRREIKRIGANHESRLRTTLAEQLEFGATMGAEYSEIGVHAAASMRRGIRNVIVTEASMRKEAASRAGMPADKLLKELIPKPVREFRKLSKTLHGDQVAANRKIYREVRAAIRDSRHMSRATTELIRVARTRTTGLGANDRLLNALQDVQKAGDALYRHGTPEALAKWRKSLRSVKRYTYRLATDGRMRPTLLEGLRKLEKAGPAQVDNVIEYWTAEKQRYNAERIIRTEQQIAFKEAQIAADSEIKAIIGYIWRMNRAARSGYVKRTKLPRSGKKLLGRRRRCICEALDGKQISVEAARARPIGHPHCMCSLIPVYGKGSLSQVSAEELAEF